jgi:mRNA-degrading endonuclease RelE of RelBE toxin-antitoxin system
MYILVFSKIIHEDIDSSYIYIKETLEAPQAAENLIKELIEKLSYIKETPYTRPLVQDKYLASYLASLGVRSIKIKNYVLYYNVEEENKSINVIRFFYNEPPRRRAAGYLCKHCNYLRGSFCKEIYSMGVYYHFIVSVTDSNRRRAAGY